MKFDNDLDEWVYNLSLEGPTEELGDVEGFGHYAMLEGITNEEIEQAARDVGNDDFDVRKMYDRHLRGVADRDGSFSAIVYTSNEGFVGVSYHRTGRDLEEAWGRIERDYEEWEADAEDYDGDDD